MSFPTPTNFDLPSPPQHSLRRRLVGTLLLALLLALLQVLWLCDHGPESELLSVVAAALLMNAATWEVWRQENGRGHLTELLAGLFFPWVMLLVMRYGLEGIEDEADVRKRHVALCLCYWALVALALSIRQGFRLRGCGAAPIRQSVVRGMRQFLYPSGFLGLALPTAASLCNLACIVIFYRFWRTLTHSCIAGVLLTTLCIFGIDGLCSLYLGEMSGFILLFDVNGGNALYEAGALLICAAVLLPCAKLVRWFRHLLGGGESPLPLLGFLSDILALLAIPCALVAALIIVACILFGVGGALSFWQ